MREGFKGSRAPFANSLISMQAERGERARAREKAISSLQTLEAKFFELFPRAVAKLQSMGCFYVYFAQQLHPNQAGAALPKRLSPIFPHSNRLSLFPDPVALGPHCTCILPPSVFSCIFALFFATFNFNVADGPSVPRKAFTFPFFQENGAKNKYLILSRRKTTYLMIDSDIHSLPRNPGN